MVRIETGSFYICPAYAGMIPRFIVLEVLLDDLSRVCGDDPTFSFLFFLFSLFVPRMRG